MNTIYKFASLQFKKCIGTTNENLNFDIRIYRGKQPMSKGLTVSDTGKCLVKGWCFTTVCQLNAAAITDNQ